MRARFLCKAFAFGVLTFLLCESAVAAQTQAAVRVVHETTAQWKAAHQLKITEARRWCGDANAPGCDFKGISGAVALPSGGIIAYGFAGPINEFDANGKFVRALGRKGQGPGEYVFVTYLNRLNDGTLIWFDTPQMRATTLTPEGKAGPIYKTLIPQTTQALWMMKDTMVVFVTPANKSDADTVDATYRTVTPSGASRVLARVRAVSLYRTGATGIILPAPFAPRVVSYVSSAGEVIHSNGGRYLFEVFPATGMPWRLDIDTPARRVTDAEHDSVVKSALTRFKVANVASLPPAIRPSYESRIATHAPLVSVFVVRDGTIWIRPVAEAGAKLARWDVFTRDGKRVGAAMLPLSADVLDGTRDWILARELDADDAPQVVRYRVGS